MISLRGDFISVTVGGAVTRDKGRVLQVVADALRADGYPVMLRDASGWKVRPAKPGARRRESDDPIVVQERRCNIIANRMEKKSAEERKGRKP